MSRLIQGILIILLFISCSEKRDPASLSGQDKFNDIEADWNITISKKGLLIADQSIGVNEPDSIHIFIQDIDEQKIISTTNKASIKIDLPSKLQSHDGSVYICLIKKGEQDYCQGGNYEVSREEVNLNTHIGPQSADVEKNELIHLVYWATDHFNNPTIPDSVVINSIPQLDVEKNISISGDLVNHIYLNPTSSADKVTIGLSSDSVHSIPEEVVLLQETPVTVELNSNNIYKIADGRQFFEIQSTVLTNLFGTPVRDGSIYELNIFENDTLVGTYPAQVVNGRLISSIKNPDRPTVWQIHILSPDGSQYPSYNVTFKPGIIDYKISLEDNDLLRISNIISPLGSSISDGSKIEIKLEYSDRTELIKKESKNGCVFIQPSVLQRGDCRVSIVQAPNVEPKLITIP